jgi:hypothetical protein
MNSAVITKIEYRLLENPDFTILAFILYSAKFNEPPFKKTSAGKLYTTTLDLAIPKITSGNDTLIKSIADRKAQFKVTDANGTVYLIGNDQFPARLAHESALDGTPGSFGGYKCKITQFSTSGCTIS